MAVTLLLAILGCREGPDVRRNSPLVQGSDSLQRMGYTIQVGAFADMNNAVQLAEKLESWGVEAYHFRDPEGLYTVRFGNYPYRDSARREAESLMTAGIIHAYFLVGPQDYAADDGRYLDSEAVRKRIVATAKQYIGIEYRWGGQSPDTGFDCSGLTMAVYRLNGLSLPRSSWHQWKTGKAVDFEDLAAGDLVFFATSKSGKVSHVGIYIGEYKFLHAPRSGREICVSSLKQQYYKSRYLGARTYL